MKKITIYTKDYCPYCNKAKDLLKEIGAKFEEVDITDAPGVMIEISEKSGFKTVPQIFADNVCLGGSDDIHKLHEEGKLLKALGME